MTMDDDSSRNRHSQPTNMELTFEQADLPEAQLSVVPIPEQGLNRI